MDQPPPPVESPDPLRQPDQQIQGIHGIQAESGLQQTQWFVEYQGSRFFPAGFWSRFWAFLIDFAVLSLMHEILLLVSGVEFPGPAELLESFSLSLESILAGSMPSEAALARMAELNRPVVFSGWLNIGLCAAYFTVFHGITGQTLGKLFLGIRVLRSDGSPVGFGWAFLRYLCYLLSSRLVYTVWVMPFDRQRRTLYDMLLKTNVFRISSQ